MPDHHGKKLARWTGLEPATPGVTGRYSNQLSYHRALERADKGLSGGRQAGNVVTPTDVDPPERIPASRASLPRHGRKMEGCDPAAERRTRPAERMNTS